MTEQGGKELHFASRDGHIDEVRKLLQANTGAGVDGKDDSNRTALHRAAANGRNEVVKLLLAEGADVGAKDNSGRTALHEAAENGHEAIVNLLLGNRIRVNMKDDSEQTALHRAAQNGHETVVKLLLKNNADVNAKDDSKQTALHLGAKKGRNEVVELLLAEGADVNTKDNSEQMALHKAAENGRATVVDLLLQGNAEPDAETNTRQTPLLLAAANGHAAVVQLLLKKGVKVRVRGIRDKELQNWWVRMAQEGVVQPLLGKDVDIDATGMGLEVALRWAAANGYEAGVELLLDKGANVNASANNGRTALHWAAEKGHEPVVTLLLDEAVDINAEDDTGETALHWAARSGHQKVVDVLLKRGANVEDRDNDGRTALHRAIETGNEDVVQLLLISGADKNARITAPKMGASKVDSPEIIPSQYIVTLQPHVSEAQAEAHIKHIQSRLKLASSDTRSDVTGVTHGSEILESSSKGGPSSTDTGRGSINVLRRQFEFPGFRGYSGSFDEATLEEIKNSWEVDMVEPNTYAYPQEEIQQRVPSWGLARICRDHPVKWNNHDHKTYAYSKNGRNTYAYVIDTGVDDTHQEFHHNRVLGGYNATRGTEGDTTDIDGHGTHVAAIIAGVTCGVAKQAFIIPVQVFERNPTNKECNAAADAIIAALYWLVQDAQRKRIIGKCVVNMSLRGKKSTSFNKAVAGVVKSGLTVVVAAGNDSVDASRVSPASAPEAIVVGATTMEDTIAWYSNFGKCEVLSMHLSNLFYCRGVDIRPAVDIFAPGTQIMSAKRGGGFLQLDGTSMASAHVAGAACCLIPTLTHSSPASVIQSLKKMARRNQIAGLQPDTLNLMVSAL